MIRYVVTALSALALAGAAEAQQKLEEVVVTAQKREQNLIEVPVSVAYVEGKELDALFDGGADIRALSTRVPGLYVESSNGRVAPRFYIRGLGNIDFDLAASQPVSVIMDEVVMENVILKSFPIFDIERVEVSRGPQGSLFGRNTTAGIVKLVSRKPTMEGNAYVDVSAGKLGSLNLEAAIGGAIGEGEKVAARLSVLSQHRDDWINNAFTGDETVIGGIEEQAARLQVLFTPTDALSILASARYRSLNGTATPFRANVFTAGSNDLNSNFDRDVVFFDEGDNNPQEYDSEGATLQIDYDFGDMTFTSITAMDQAEGRSLGDIDGGYGAVFLPIMGPGFIPFPSQTQDAADVEQFTQEFRLASAPSGGIGWQVGAFFFDSELDITTNPFFVPPTTVSHTNEAWAVFGQVTVPLGDDLEFIGGLRYTDDEKTLTATGFNVDLADDQISGDLTISYTGIEDATLYARYANGFKAPTIQGRDIAFGAPPSSAKSETADSFEIGYKRRLFDGRGQMSAAIYHYVVDDIQFSAVGGAANSIQLVNAERGTGTGLEIEGRFLVTDNFEVTAGYAYNDTEIDDPNLRVGPCGSGACTVTDPLDANGFAIVDGNPFPNAPDFTLSVAGEFFVPFGAGEFFAYADYALQGRTNIFLYESAEFFTEDQFELGLQLGYRKPDGSFEGSFFARNLTDEENVQGAIDFNNLTGFVNEPRVYGVKFTARFD